MKIIKKGGFKYLQWGKGKEALLLDEKLEPVRADNEKLTSVPLEVINKDKIVYH